MLTEFLTLHLQLQREINLTGRFIDLVYEDFDLAIRLGTLEDSTPTTHCSRGHWYLLQSYAPHARRSPHQKTHQFVDCLSAKLKLG